MQTNSRGETLVFLRNAGERQVAVFFDGALLNVPWDNRVDLGLIPAAAIARLSVVRGVTPVEYGANTIGGAVNVMTRSPLTGAPGAAVDSKAGGAGLFEVAGSAVRRIGTTGILLGAGYRRHGDMPLAAGADLPFNQIGSRRRSNTDLRQAQGYLRVEHMRDDGGAVAASVLFVDGEKGVAPEGHVPPGDARFWRYPDWRMWMGIVSGDGAVGNGLDWKGSVWIQAFDQTIDSFGTVALARRDERQRDENLTYGARLILSRDLSFGRLLYALNGLLSTHDQTNLTFPDDAAAGEGGQAFLSFRQWTLSQGLEYEAGLGDRFDLSLGVGLDLMAAPRTGDKPGIGDFVVWNLAAAARYALAPDWSLRAAVGRKTRLPTLRELFGTALRRFLVNPDLKPESAFLAELALEGRWRNGGLHLAPFASVVNDGIDQRNVVVDGRSLRQRINLAGSHTLGVEIGGDLDLPAGLALDGHVTHMRTRGRRAPADAATLLPEKPRLIARAALTHHAPSGLDTRLEIAHRGRAFSLGPLNELVPLAVSTTLNLRLAYRLERVLPALGGVEIYLRIDNLTDGVIEPQAGLPDAGRWLKGGLRASF